MNRIKSVFPPIGLRIIKSAVGVFLCFIVDYLRGGAGIVFYSQLAVLWCMQDYISETKAKAFQRTIGTTIGAVFGLILLVIYKYIPSIPSLANAAVVALFIVIVLYTTVVIKKKDASYFSCVVFLSIVINHAADVNPFIFVWNRFLDTMIGIVLGVLVNAFSLPKKRNKDILFVSGLDDTLLSKDDNLSGYSRVELNRMIESGMKFTISTMRTPASLMKVTKDIKLNLPVIVMDGAALYDIKENRYIREYVISHNHSKQITDFLDAQGIPYFANVIIDDLLVIYYKQCESDIYNYIISSLRSSPYRNYVNRPLPDNEDVVYFMLVDETPVILELYKKLIAEEFCNELKILCYESTDYPGKSYIKIYNHNARKENMLDYLKKSLGVQQVITFGTIQGRYTHLINSGDSNKVVKLMKKEFEPLAFTVKKH